MIVKDLNRLLKLLDLPTKAKKIVILENIFLYYHVLYLKNQCNFKFIKTDRQEDLAVSGGIFVHENDEYGIGDYILTYSPFYAVMAVWCNG